MKGASSLLLGLLLGLFLACGGGAPSDAPGTVVPATRGYRMGFSPVPPRDNSESVVAALEMWTPRADAGIHHFEIPYKALLSGTTAEGHIRAEHLPLAQYYRAKGLPMWVTFDCTNGIDRAAESTELTDLGRSIQEPAIQKLYREYVTTYASIIEPGWIALAAETNLIRTAAPAGGVLRHGDHDQRGADLNPKAGLAVWDGLYARTRR